MENHPPSNAPFGEYCNMLKSSLAIWSDDKLYDIGTGELGKHPLT